MLVAELGAVDGPLLGDELSDGAALGSPLGITERIGWTEGALDVTVTELVVTNVMAVRAMTHPCTSFTAPNVMAVRAMTLPCTTFLAPNVIADPARIEPLKTLSAPEVKAVSRTHNTFSALAPLLRIIWQFASVTIVAPDWKINTEFGSPFPSKVTLVKAAILMVPEE
jgi:hypothetical protein